MKTNKKNNIFSRFLAGLREKIRKFFVGLKKNPQAIPLVALCVTFLEYSLNMTDISNTTAKIYGPNMGLCAFVTMLFMILSFVCMLNAFPKRQKPKISMIAVMMVLYGIIILADINYLNCINNGLIKSGDSLNEAAKTYIYSAYSTVSVHIILIIVTILLVLLEPVFAKLFKKINTSIEVEGSGNIENIDIADEE